MSEQTVFKIAPQCQIPVLAGIYAKYFSGVSRGTFVEVGANDGYSWSNTWGLAEAGWRGLYFEPVADLAEKCRQRHKNNNVLVVQMCVADHDGETKMYLGQSVTTSPYVAQTNVYGYGNKPDRFVVAPACMLNTALMKYGIEKNFELLVIDVDGDEVGVLNGIDLEIWKPKMIIVETGKEHPKLDWRFNAEPVHKILCGGYDEIYADAINSIYFIKD